MYLSSVTALALLLAPAAAKTCVNQTIPIQVSARQAIFDLAVPQTSLEATDFILNVTQQGRNFTNTVLTGYNTTIGTYNISTQFCLPSSNGTNATSPSTLQILTHGIGFDKTYWDLSFNNYNYSYINVATDVYKYATFSYDRLGIGNSSHGEPLNEIQSFIEVETLAQLTRMLRNGSFPGINYTPKKVVHVGHSFGSAQTYSLANLYPNITDGIVLTGFSMNASFVNLFAAGGNFQQANLNEPLRFSSITGTQVQNRLNMYAGNVVDLFAPIDITTLPKPQNLPNGYLISSNTEADKYLFLKPHYYDPDILRLAERTKQPVTLGELLTLGSVTLMNNFAGPVLVIAGDADLPYCGSNCTATGGVAPSLQAEVSKNFPSVSAANFSSYVQPNTGHGINLHYNATGAYSVINAFLASKSL